MLISLWLCLFVIKLYSHNDIFKNILFENQSSLQSSHSTKHTVIQLINQLLECFEENQYALGIFIELSKIFDIVNHDVILKKNRNVPY